MPFSPDFFIITSAGLMTILSIVFTKIDAMCCYVFVCLIHPAAFTYEVLCVAVHQLLYWVLLQLAKRLCLRDHCEWLKGRSGAEGPAGSTTSLVIRSCDKALFIPVLVVREGRALWIERCSPKSLLRLNTLSLSFFCQFRWHNRGW